MTVDEHSPNSKQSGVSSNQSKPSSTTSRTKDNERRNSDDERKERNRHLSDSKHSNSNHEDGLLIHRLHYSSRSGGRQTEATRSHSPSRGSGQRDSLRHKSRSSRRMHVRSEDAIRDLKRKSHSSRKITIPPNDESQAKEHHQHRSSRSHSPSRGDLQRSSLQAKSYSTKRILQHQRSQSHSPSCEDERRDSSRKHKSHSSRRLEIEEQLQQAYKSQVDDSDVTKELNHKFSSSRKPVQQHRSRSHSPSREIRRRESLRKQKSSSSSRRLHIEEQLQKARREQDRARELKHKSHSSRRVHSLSDDIIPARETKHRSSRSHSPSPPRELKQKHRSSRRLDVPMGDSNHRSRSRSSSPSRLLKHESYSSRFHIPPDDASPSPERELKPTSYSSRQLFSAPYEAGLVNEETRPDRVLQQNAYSSRQLLYCPPDDIGPVAYANHSYRNLGGIQGPANHSFRNLGDIQGPANRSFRNLGDIQGPGIIPSPYPPVPNQLHLNNARPPQRVDWLGEIGMCGPPDTISTETMTVSLERDDRAVVSAANQRDDLKSRIAMLEVQRENDKLMSRIERIEAGVAGVEKHARRSKRHLELDSFSSSEEDESEYEYRKRRSKLHGAKKHRHHEQGRYGKELCTRRNIASTICLLVMVIAGAAALILSHPSNKDVGYKPFITDDDPLFSSTVFPVGWGDPEPASTTTPEPTSAVPTSTRPTSGPIPLDQDYLDLLADDQDYLDLLAELNTAAPTAGPTSSPTSGPSRT